MTYNEYLLAMIGVAGTTATDQAFLDNLPNIINYAEQRIYRELDLISQTVSDSTVKFAISNRNLNLPAATYFVELKQINVITPSSTTNPESGTRNPLTPVSRDFLNFVYNSSTGATIPAYFAMQTDQSIVVGPWPDATYTVEFVGLVRPAPLSAQNPTTFLTLRLPDLFKAASAVYIMGYQRDFGAQADDPKAAQSWETQYQTLFASADAEELRRTFATRTAPSPVPA